jgi:hypothetical protein
MKRRGFLQLLGAAAAAPFVVNAELIATPAAPPVDLPRVAAGDNLYQMIRAHKDLRKGDVVCFEEGKPAGVAVANITKGNYGFMQIRGMCTLKVRHA